MRSILLAADCAACSLISSAARTRAFGKSPASSFSISSASRLVLSSPLRSLRGSLTPCDVNHAFSFSFFVAASTAPSVSRLMRTFKSARACAASAGRCRGQRRVDAYSAIVDLCVEHPRVLLRRR